MGTLAWQGEAVLGVLVYQTCTHSRVLQERHKHTALGTALSWVPCCTKPCTHTAGSCTAPPRGTHTQLLLSTENSPTAQLGVDKKAPAIDPREHCAGDGITMALVALRPAGIQSQRHSAEASGVGRKAERKIRFP